MCEFRPTTRSDRYQSLIAELLGEEAPAFPLSWLPSCSACLASGRDVACNYSRLLLATLKSAALVEAMAGAINDQEGKFVPQAELGTKTLRATPAASAVFQLDEPTPLERRQQLNAAAGAFLDKLTASMTMKLRGLRGLPAVVQLCCHDQIGAGDVLDPTAADGITGYDDVTKAYRARIRANS
jgi:hypothetical protein